jgi:hypothetical protein
MSGGPEVAKRQASLAYRYCSTWGTGLTTEQMTGEAARGNMTGFDFDDTWKKVPDGYPKIIRNR